MRAHQSQRERGPPEQTPTPLPMCCPGVQVRVSGGHRRWGTWAVEGAAAEGGCSTTSRVVSVGETRGMRGRGRVVWGRAGVACMEDTVVSGLAADSQCLTGWVWKFEGRV